MEERLRTRIGTAMGRLQQNYPDLVTDPPPAPPAATATATALLEIVFEPRGSSETLGYDVHTHWHPPSGDSPQSGPRRECDDGGRLDVRAGDQVLAFAHELFEGLAAVAADAGSNELVFQFRVPDELMLHPFEHWPEDQAGIAIPIGRDYPVVVAARERRGQAVLACRTVWACLKPHLHEPWCNRHWCPEEHEVPTDQALLGRLIERIDAAPCALLTCTPNLSDPRRRPLLALLLARGVPIALWPRCAAAETGLRDCLEGALGAGAIAKLPLAVRDQRRRAFGRADAHPVWTHLTLFWDDPSRTAVRPPAGRFFRGLG